jgi:hypothetical protein
MPATQSFLDESLAGTGWMLHPVQLARRPLERGDFVELPPGQGLERRLLRQINRLASDQLQDLTRSILSAARREPAHE